MVTAVTISAYSWLVFIQMSLIKLFNPVTNEQHFNAPQIEQVCPFSSIFIF